MAARITTSLVKRRHAWTSLDIPWRIDVGDEELSSLPVSHREGWRLFHYLSGGGLRAFAGSAMREVVSRRQTRFLWFFGIMLVCWMVLRLI